MKKTVFKPTVFSSVRARIIPLLFTAAVVAIVLAGLRQAEASSRAEGLRVLDESIRRAAVKCYAVEGTYPADLDYIEQHYGVHVDRTKYIVHYTVFASNIMPDIVIFEQN